MSLSNNGDVEAKVASYLARSDLSSYIPDFIVAAETRIAYGAGKDERDPMYSPPLRVRAMETTETLVPSAGAVSLPTGFLGFRSLYADEALSGKLEQTTPEIFYGQHMNSNGNRGFYIIEGNNLVVSNGISSNIRAIYYKKFDPLASALPVPWLLTASPMTYVYGALIEATPFIRGDVRIPTWMGFFRSSIEGLNSADKRDRWGGSVVAVRSDAGNP